MAKSNALCLLAAMFLVASAVIAPKPAFAETDGGNFIELPGEICMASNGKPFLVQVKKEVGTGRIALRLENSENWSAASSAAHQIMSEDHLYVFRGRSDFAFTRLDLDGQVETGGCSAIDQIYRDLQARAAAEAAASMEDQFTQALADRQIVDDELARVLQEKSALERNVGLLEARLAQISLELAEAKLTAESLRTQAEAASEELTKQKDELTALQARTAAALAARMQVEKKLEEATEETDALRLAIAQLTQDSETAADASSLEQQVAKLGADLNSALARSAQLVRLLGEEEDRAEAAEAFAATEAEARRIESEAVACLLQAAEAAPEPNIEFLRQQLDACRAGLAPVNFSEPRFRPDLDELEAALTDALSGAPPEELTVSDKASAGRNPLMVLTAAELDTFRREVMKCWMIDPGSAASRVSLVVSVEMTPEGKPVSDSISLVSFDGVDIQAVEQAYQSARRAILRCGAKGYTLPAAKYDSWKTAELKFVAE